MRNLENFDGDSFADQIHLGLRFVSADGTPGATGLATREFSLKSNVFSLFGTYGLTDRWDVNVLLPLFFSSLSLRGVERARVGEAAEAFPLGASANAFGPGDLFLRTKYRVAVVDEVKLAAALTLRLPTGNEDNFQGLGDTIVAPAVVASRAWGRQEVRATLGFELNAGDLQRTRAFYAIGGTIQPWARVGFPIDVIGSSSFVNDTFTIPARGKIVPSSLPTGFIQSVSSNEVAAFVPQSNVVDIAIGVKANPWRTLVIYANAIVPLTNDGLRAPVLPAGGVEYRF
jgi:hypothetical protein